MPERIVSRLRTGLRHGRRGDGKGLSRSAAGAMPSRAAAWVAAMFMMMSLPPAAAQGASVALADTLGPAVSAQAGDAPGGGAGAPARTEALTLGMAYVVPPHVPGSKVRTPEGLAPLLAERLDKRLPLRAVPASRAAVAADGPGLRKVDALLLPLGPGDARAQDAVVILTGYRAGIMAIMRTDTDIRRWEDLRGRTVCLAEGGGLAGQMQARYGAIEKVYRAPADALLDLRIGGCDATVHDSTMLEALLEFPEWRKFSARLPVQQERDLAFVVPRDDTGLARTLESQVAEWRQSGLLATLTRQAARDIAFEVYLDQEVPDCH